MESAPQSEPIFLFLHVQAAKSPASCFVPEVAMWVHEEKHSGRNLTEVWMRALQVCTSRGPVYPVVLCVLCTYWTLILGEHRALLLFTWNELHCRGIIKVNTVQGQQVLFNLHLCSLLNATVIFGATVHRRSSIHPCTRACSTSTKTTRTQCTFRVSA